MHDASSRQVTAARPGWSTWLSANAGSGKTRVLTDRVARLLLAGVDPARILCLTYTKAAASEMQNRLFARLGAWAMKPEAALRQALEELGEGADVSQETLADARRLFARAIETPGGLRIQTIHSFCASLLRRFPLEARVSPQFTELDDRAAKLLREEIIEELAAQIAPDVIAEMAALYTGEDFGQLAAEVAAHSDLLLPAKSAAEAKQAFGLRGDDSAETLLAEVFLGDEAAWMPDALEIIARGKATDVKLADRLAALNFAQPDLGTLSALEGLFLFGANTMAPFTAKTETLPTKDTRTALGDLLGERLANLMRRVEAARPRRTALLASERMRVLHRFAGAFLPLYERRKMLRGALDFDDLIARAKALLTDPAVAQWVLFRLDGGIDHILVDEAQDTSPDQWAVIELLAQEFTSGAGARDLDRTIFVVGDQKQSIYSFQGADVTGFARMRAQFQSQLDTIGAPFQSLELRHSFRSSPAILDLVDRTFSEALHPDLGGPSAHIAFNEDMPGRIEIWPPIEPSANPEDEDWADPVDLVTGEHHAAELGRRVASRIAEILAAGTLIPDRGTMRPVHAGDILILVRRRSPLFTEVIRACKAAGLPIAGADRLHLGGEMAVKDLISLLAFLTMPEDDLALAECLRSPLLGLDEAGLYALAQPRKGYLWEALRNNPDHTEIVSILQDLRNHADYLRPFELLERALTRHDGRRKFLARLGAEAEDGIDELLSQAMAYERSDVPSLTGFLTWLQSDDVQVKRQMESGGRKIRVMTVHGAKGLEAPIVILPDTADTRANDRDEIYPFGETALWRTPAAESPEAVTSLRRERADRAKAESTRLLYVALTRAQSWLIVAAAGNLASQKNGGDKDPAWYDLIRKGAEALGAQPGKDGVLRYALGDWPLGESVSDTAETAPDSALPDWALRAAPLPDPGLKPRSASALGGAKVLLSDNEPEEGEAARLRGTMLHLLLEHLPGIAPTDWPPIAEPLVPDAALRKELLAEVNALLAQPELAALFAQPALLEVSVTAEYEGERLVGTIDRLVLTADRALIIDYKSNRLVPKTEAEVPEGLLRQMRAYAHALRQIYPHHQIECAILWTAQAQLMPIASV
ncbi:double-strand break repair helicase AddA [Gemmobacter serpentinus]|uniref:double-strand break repair helicase AddA n=1 Tax=Gemmobacter serpentinus TaxID=2652247 RepID=UPI00124D7742|nr:double-strand break repair helicase AddA [Gemmobacter serpentinus]